MEDKKLTELLKSPFPRIELKSGRFLLHRSENERLEIESPIVPILITETLETLPDEDARIDFLLALIKLTSSSDKKIEALIHDLATATHIHHPF